MNKKQCPGTAHLGDQYILYCSCGMMDVDDEWEETHSNIELECFRDGKGICMWRKHEGRPCKELPAFIISTGKETLLNLLRLKETLLNLLRLKETLLNLLRLLVEGGNNTSEFLSLAGQHTKINIPSYEDIVELYKTIIKETKIN